MYLESFAQIRFPDCDPFNHLNNTRYLDYFLNAREDHLLTHYDFKIYEFAVQQQRGWVVSGHQIAYLKPALLMETVCLQSRLLYFGEKDVLVEMLMWDEQKLVLKSVLWTTFVHIDLKSARSIEHSQELKDRFTPHLRPLDSPVKFEERIAQLKTTIASRL